MSIQYYCNGLTIDTIADYPLKRKRSREISVDQSISDI